MWFVFTSLRKEGHVLVGDRQFLSNHPKLISNCFFCQTADFCDFFIRKPGGSQAAKSFLKRGHASSKISSNHSSKVFSPVLTFRSYTVRKNKSSIPAPEFFI